MTDRETPPESPSSPSVVPAFIEDAMSPPRNSGGCVCLARPSFHVPRLDSKVLAAATGLSQKEVTALHARFRKIAPKGFMTKDQFRQTLGLLGMTPNDYIPSRMFAAFDSNDDGVITFDEYLASFAVLLRGSEDDRLRLSFKLAHSSGSDNQLSFFDFQNLVLACQTTTTALLEREETITEAEIQSLFRDIAGEGEASISLDAYMQGVRTNSRFLEILGIARKTKRSNLSPPASPTRMREQLDLLRAQLASELQQAVSTDVQKLLGKLDSILQSESVPGRETPEIETKVVKANMTSKVPKKGHTLLGPKKGLAVHFGHENWNMVLSMMIGIRLAVGRASFEVNRPVQSIDFDLKDKFSLVPQLSNFLDSKISTKIRVNRFIDYAPLVFRKLREEISGISEDEYLRSVGPEQLLGNMVLGNLSSLAELTTEGKGGAFFYYTADGRFMIKTVRRDEKRLLKQILRSYYHHLKANPKSLIVRFYGLHGLQVKRSSGLRRSQDEIFFVVMGNLFNTPLEVHRRFDLKGSWVNRSSGGADDPTVAMKDNEFCTRKEILKIGPDQKKTLTARIKADCQFFAQHGIIDYSLLLGIHDRSQPNDQLDALGEGLLSADGTTVYYLGIIDILCEWNTKKKLENFFKAIRYDSKGISAVPPQEYADRFYRFIESHIE